MNRLLVIVEGQTEEEFVDEVLAPFLVSCGYSSVQAQLMGEARLRSKRGGIRAWSAVRRVILSRLKQDSGCVVSTMVDYYGLPRSGKRAWPSSGRSEATPPALPIEEGMQADIAAKGGAVVRRFVPYVAMHEFEALLFSDCAVFGKSIGRIDLIRDLERIREAFSNPEAIDDSPTGAPSKRIKRLISDYNKPFHGNIAALYIGVETMRRECPHFARWLEALQKAVTA